MKNFVLAFLVFLLYSVFGMWYYACVIKEVCPNTDEEIEQPINNSTSINEIDTGISDLEQKDLNTDKLAENSSEKVTLNIPDRLVIKQNKNSVTFPNGQNTFAEFVYNFLNNNQGKELVITGFLNSAESAINDQLGLNRARFIKNLLVDYGINKNRVSTQSKLVDFEFDVNQEHDGGISLNLVNISEAKQKAIESGIENKLLYSGFGSKEFRADNSLKAYAIELKNYLEKYPGKTANIIGHTDSVGDNLANDWYGMERAKNVKKYLVSQGIQETRLLASSKGETEPIATNGTLEGRRKNRRIEIKIN